MLLHYTNGIRVVIHTANLIEEDWSQKTQGFFFYLFLFLLGLARIIALFELFELFE